MAKPYVKVWQTALEDQKERMVLSYLLSMVENQMSVEQESGWDAYMLSRAQESLNHTLKGKKL